jgi:hypothetical protein
MKQDINYVNKIRIFAAKIGFISETDFDILEKIQ